MDVGILNINEWYDWLALWLAGSLAGAMTTGRLWGAQEKYWHTDSGTPIAKSSWDDGPPPSFGAMLWPLILPITLVMLFAKKIDKIGSGVNANRLIYGKPPKHIKDKAREEMLKRADRLLEEA
jgi:hypothetical protein